MDSMERIEKMIIYFTIIIVTSLVMAGVANGYLVLLELEMHGKLTNLENKQAVLEIQVKEQPTAIENKLKEQLAAIENKLNKLETNLANQQTSLETKLTVLQTQSKEQQTTLETQLAMQKADLASQLQTQQTDMNKQLQTQQTAMNKQLQTQQEQLTKQADKQQEGQNKLLKDIKVLLEAESERQRVIAEQKRIAAEAEAQRIAAEAEAQRIAAEAKAQRIAAEAKAQRIAAEAKRLAEAEAKFLAMCGAPEDFWSKCHVEENGREILDMTKPVWQSLPFQQQKEYAEQYQAGYAKAYGLKVTKVHTVAGVEFPMKLIPPGVYYIGSPSNEPNHESNESQTRVVIAEAFYVGTTELTQGQYEAVMGKNPSNFKGKELPVETISWPDAIEFCAKMSEKTNESFRLPTEYEWEYFCRAGTTTPFNIGPNISPVVVNYYGEGPYNGAPKGEYRSKTVNCGSLSNQNAWGLWDTHGNVWEWCLDPWGQAYSSQTQNANSIKLNQFQNVTAGRRIIRGGSWYSSAQNCRSAYRSGNSGPNFCVGCRLASVL